MLAYPVQWWLASWRKVIHYGNVEKVWSVRAVTPEYAQKSANAPWCRASYKETCDLANSYKYKRSNGEWGVLTPEYPAEAERHFS